MRCGEVKSCSCQRRTRLENIELRCATEVSDLERSPLALQSSAALTHILEDEPIEDMVSWVLSSHVKAFSFEAVLSGPRSIKMFGPVLNRNGCWQLERIVRVCVGGEERLQMCLDVIYEIIADLKAPIKM